MQGDAFNRSSIQTVVTVPLTSNLGWAAAPGNVRLTARATGLRRESLANVSQVVTLDKSILTERVGSVSYAAYRHHYSLFPASGAVVAALGDELTPYLAGKGTIHFPADRPIPSTLVAKVVKVRLEENARRHVRDGAR